MQPFALEVHQNREASHHHQAEVNVFLYIFFLIFFIYILMVSLESHNWIHIPGDARNGLDVPRWSSSRVRLELRQRFRLIAA